MLKMSKALLPACFIIGISVLQISASPNQKEQSQSQSQLSYRLPTDVYPEYYRLEILTNLADYNDNFTFEGRTWIQVKCKTATDKIILHSKNLVINEDEVSVTLHDGMEVLSQSKDEKKCVEKCKKDDKIPLKILSHCYHDEYEFYIINLAEKLKPGLTYSVFIPYEGELTQGLEGYYRSSYKDLKTGSTKWLTVTQFESTDARRALPCFDEPSFKAKFQVNLGHINSRTSISNMRIQTTEPIKEMENWVWDRYEPTVPMSTYLLAFIVSDFDFKVSPKAKSNDVLFRVWARKDAIDQVDYATAIGPKILEYYESYFDIKYPLPKQDMIAIPDFNSGAMENWGLITYREVALLFDTKRSSASSQPYVASVIAHELAHQWFGNLVTMNWWTDLWLNEGFATYVASRGVHYLHPEWNSLDEDIVDTMLSVFRLDALKSSHPISVPIGHPKEIAQIFDTISYRKASFMLRMMNLFLGEDTFRTGVSNYLKKYAYGNAEQDDLWQSLTEVAHKSGSLPANTTVKMIMDTWTLQTGYPIISVDRDYESGTATISQARYLGDRTGDLSEERSTWYIPLSYTYESEADFNATEPKQWMSCSEKEIVIKDIPSKDWVIFNIKIGGIYKVRYDKENWDRLIKALNSDNYKKIDILNRIQLIDDSLDLAKTGDIDYSIAFRVIQYLEKEKEYLPWKTALSNLAHVDKMLRFYPLYSSFRAFMKNLLTPIYEEISNKHYEAKPENLHKLKLQTLISSWSCSFDVGDCKKKAIKVFQDWMEKDEPDSDNPVSKDTRSYTYCTAIKYGNEEEWRFLWKRYLNSNVGNERSMILSALSCTREIWLLARFLEWSIDEKSGIRKQDSASVFGNICRRDIGYFLARSFFKNRISDIYEYFGPKTTRLGHYVGVIANQITSESEFAELNDFTKQNAKYLQQSIHSVKQGLENAKINIQWQSRFYKRLNKFLPSDVI